MLNSIFDNNGRASSRRIRQRQLVFFFLFLVVITRAIVPPGYMPSPIDSTSSITMFMLCGGDDQSAQLLDAWQSDHHGHSMGHADSHHADGHGFELCEFDALSMTLADLSGAPITPFVGTSSTADTPILVTVGTRPPLRNHPARAPPPGFVSSEYTT